MGVTVDDLTAGYQSKIKRIQTMINAIPDDLKKPFRVAMNYYDDIRKERDSDTYMAYGMKALAMLGWYYDCTDSTWKQDPFDWDPNDKEKPYSFDEAVRRKYQSVDIGKNLGVGLWQIEDALVEPAIVEAAKTAGEMTESDILFSIIDGEQAKGKKNKKPEIKVPNIPISPNANVEEMTKGDDSNDKFIYAYSDSGISKNKRNWRPIIMESIANQVMTNMPPGHYGHMKPQDVGFVMPPPVVTWIGATTEKLSDDVTRLWLKGYIIPLEDGDNLKTYIRTKAVDSISVWGGLTLLPNEETGISDVLDIDLKSIDISGKLKEGLHSGIVKTAGEMETGGQQSAGDPENNGTRKQENEKGGNDNMDKETIIKGLSVNDIKAHNPGLLDGLKTAVMDSLNVEAKQRTMLAAAGEMETIEKEVGFAGEQATAYVKQMKSFAGEMEAVLEMPKNSPFTAIIDKVKATVEKSGVVDKISEAIQPAQNQDVLARAQELAAAEQTAKNTAAIEAVKAKFTELTADVTNDVIKDMIADSFASVLEAKPEGLASDFEQTAIANMMAQMPTVKEKVLNRAKSLLETGKAAGEMAIFDNLGVGKGSTGTQDVSKMTDEEYAKYLGYGV